MLAKCIDRSRWHRIDRVWANQFFHVHHVAIVWILGAGAGPQHALRLGALGGKFLPVRSAEDLLIALIGQLSVCIGDLPQQALQQRLLIRVRSTFQLLVQH